MVEVFDLTFNGAKVNSRKIFKVLLHAETPYFSKQFIYMLIVSAIVIFVSLTYGASRGNQVEMEVADQTLGEVREMASEATWLSLFINNVSMALMTFIPLFGAVWMVLIQYNTGWYIGAMAKASGVDYLMVMSMILTSVVGLVEYVAYILALGESLVLVYSAVQKGFKQRLMQHSWKSVFHCCFVVVYWRGCRGVYVGGIVKPGSGGC